MFARFGGFRVFSLWPLEDVFNFNFERNSGRLELLGAGAFAVLGSPFGQVVRFVLL